MKVILLGELRGRGGEGDVIDVAQGYAENFLFPKRIAIPATPGNMKQLEERRHTIAKREEQRIAAAEAAREALDGKTVTIEARVGEEGQLFGSVTTAMIEQAIREQLQAEVDRKRIERSAVIKTAGLHTVTINLYREISATLNVAVGDPATNFGQDAPEAPASEDESAEAAESADTEAAPESEATAESTEGTEAPAAEAEETPEA